MNINDFFNNANSQTTFIDRLSAVLGITDKSRIKIVGVVSGSININTHIYPSTVNGSTPMSQVNQNVQSSISSGSLQSSMSSAGFGTMLGASSSYYAMATVTSEDNGSLGTGVIIGAVLGSAVAIAAVIAIVVIMRRKKL